MGNILSPTKATATTGGDVSTKLSEADSQALTVFLRHTSEQAAERRMEFDTMLWTFLHSATENGSDPAQIFSKLINCTDNGTQADAIHRLGRLDTIDFTTFARSVCTSAIAQFWNKEPTAGASDSSLSWVVEWVTMPKETTSATSIDAWRAWWRQSALLREVVELALRSSLHLEKSRVLILGVSEANLTCPELSANDLNRMLGGELLLTAEMGWALSRELPPHSRKRWQCAYSSRRDGRSWSTFQGSMEGRGSILLLVSEKKKKKKHSTQRVFGAYLDSDVVRQPSWHGTSQNFLFTADFATGLSVYRATGFNDHYQYLNYAMQTLPNGLGVGGQIEHFGLWIDSGFVSGSSNPSATYDSPQLSTQYDFAIGTVEAWVVRASTTASDSSGKVSAITANPEAVALLEMANRPMYSTPAHRGEVDP